MDELRICSAGSDHIVAGELDVQQRVMLLDLHDLIDKSAEFRSFAAADQQLEGIPVGIDIVDARLDIALVFRVKRLVVEKLLLLV